MATDVVRVGMRTPWGTAQTAEIIATGIGVVSTASHGGIKLSPARNAAVPKPLRREGGWYEEDCDALIPLYVFHADTSRMRRLTPRELWDQLTHWFPEQVAEAFPAGRAEELADRVIVAPAGRYTDPERQALAASDEEANAKLAADGPALDGDRCHQCKGFGLVRGVGKRAGQRYRTLTGAQAAQDAGRAVDCPVCAGLGLVGFEPSTHPEDGTRVIDTGRAILADSPLVEAARESGHLQVITVGR